MVVHIRTRAGLLVIFSRDGREVESDLAPTGDRALKSAVLMLARLDHLQDGDQLTVREVDR